MRLYCYEHLFRLGKANPARDQSREEEAGDGDEGEAAEGHRAEGQRAGSGEGRAVAVAAVRGARRGVWPLVQHLQRGVQVPT